MTTIVCDESGSEGDRVANTRHPVFAHAAVALDSSTAADVVEELHTRLRPQGRELKASQLRHPKAKKVACWLFSPTGPLAGNASVYLIEKSYFVASKIIDGLVEEWTHARGVDLYSGRRAERMAHELAVHGPKAFPPDDWESLLINYNDIARNTTRQETTPSVDDLCNLLERMRQTCRRPILDETMWILSQCRQHVETLVSRRDEPGQIRWMEPLFSALPSTVRHWTTLRGGPIHVVHDNQSAFKESPVAAMRTVLKAQGAEVASFSLVDSRSDPRVQLADMLAGNAREVATRALRGEAVPGLATSTFATFLTPALEFSNDRVLRKLRAMTASTG